MWGYLKRLKQKKEQRKRLVAQKIIDLKTEVKKIDEKVRAILLDEMRKSTLIEIEKNSICPKCLSVKVNDRIKKTQGKLNANIHGSGWVALTFGDNNLSGNISGEMDMLEVNKCNDCGHEWIKYKATRRSFSEIILGELDYIVLLLKKHYDATKCTYNPLDLNEEFNSFEEKRKTLLLKAKDNINIERISYLWSGITIDTFKEVAKKYYCDYQNAYLQKYYNEELLLSFGFKKYSQKTNI